MHIKVACGMWQHTRIREYNAAHAARCANELYFHPPPPSQPPAAAEQLDCSEQI